jgi:sigma54-dependent transcription regulator
LATLEKGIGADSGVSEAQSDDVALTGRDDLDGLAEGRERVRPGVDFDCEFHGRDHGDAVGYVDSRAAFDLID